MADPCVPATLLKRMNIFSLLIYRLIEGPWGVRLGSRVFSCVCSFPEKLKRVRLSCSLISDWVVVSFEFEYFFACFYVESPFPYGFTLEAFCNRLSVLKAFYNYVIAKIHRDVTVILGMTVFQF